MWTALDSRHTIFKTPEAAWRSPVDYDDETYFDAATDEIVQRLVKVTAAAFGEGWRIAMLYQPAGLALTRVQANLFAREDKVHVYARGSSLRETCQNLYRNAASHFADHD